MNNSVSASHYLFRKEAHELYDASVVADAFVNQSLDVLMRVNILFLSKKENDGLPFLDPAARNNQCHLYSVFAAKLIKGYKDKTEYEKLAMTEENRFLHLSFILSFTFLNERHLLCQAIEKISEQASIALPEPKKQFYTLIMDSLKGCHGKLIRTARLALNELFEQCIKKTFFAEQENSLTHKELYLLSLEELRHASVDSELTLYTLPKLAGVAYLVHEKIPIIFKTKVITREGTSTLFYQTNPAEDEEPVLVFEGISSDDYSVEQFRNIARQCPTYFERDVDKNRRHPQDQICRFCNPFPPDTSFLKRFEVAMLHFTDSLYALGADFVTELQPSFTRFFVDHEKYPILTELFQRSQNKIDALGVSMHRPVAFTVHHVYVDRARSARKCRLRMNGTPEAFLRARGYL